MVYIGKKINPDDLLGKQFGRLTVKSYAGKKGWDHYYLCNCQCGAEKIILRRSLLSGKSKSCGCSNKESRTDRNAIIGQKFGRLTVCSFSHNDTKTQWYKCQCDCGNIVIEQKSHLMHYTNITCGNCTKVIIEGDYLRYICRNGESFIFDREDLSIIEQHRWCMIEGYPSCNYKNKTVKLHRILLVAKENEIVDHINGDTHDNRRRNLRIATHADNARNCKIQSTNKVGYKGVHRTKNGEKYYSIISCNGKAHRLGIFDTPEDAARAYDMAARYYFGKFACVNFPLPGEQGCRRNQTA